MPSQPHPQRSGRANSSRMRQTDSRKAPIVPRQHPDPGRLLARARGLQRVPFEPAAGVGEETAETDGRHGQQPPRGQHGALGHREDPPVGVVVPDERHAQRAAQGRHPGPVDPAEHRAHGGETGHVGEPRPGREFQRDRQHDEREQRQPDVGPAPGHRPGPRAATGHWLFALRTAASTFPAAWPASPATRATACLARSWALRGRERASNSPCAP